MIVHEYDGTDLTAPSTVQLQDETQGFTARAAGAESTTCTVFVDDPDGSLDFVSFKTWRIRETAAPSGNRVFWAGFVAEQRISRGSGPIYPSGSGRRWELDLEECNSFVRRRLLTPGDGANRQSETVSARIAWLLTTVGFTGGLIVDHGLIQSSAVRIGAFDYTGQTGKDVLDGCAVASGYTPHIRYREASDDYELIFINFLTSSLDASELQISNVTSDLATPVANPWVPNEGATLHRSPERRASGFGIAYPGGFVYQQDAGTQAVIGDVDLMSPAGDVDTKSMADALALRLLAQQADDEERVDNLTLRLPAANVNDAKQGQLISAKFQHFLPTDWHDFRYCRILQRSIRRPDNLTQGSYDVDYEIVPASPSFAVTSLALLRGPNDNNYVADSSATFRVNCDGDGDTATPPGGCSLEPLTGPFTYVGSAGERTGIQCDGSGPVHIYCQGTAAGADRDTVVLNAYVLLNGAAVGSDTQSTSGDLRAINWTWTIDVTVDVVDGDVIEIAFARTATTNPFVIPTGTGNCANLLRVSGDLVAA